MLLFQNPSSSFQYRKCVCSQIQSCRHTLWRIIPVSFCEHGTSLVPNTATMPRSGHHLSYHTWCHRSRRTINPPGRCSCFTSVQRELSTLHPVQLNTVWRNASVEIHAHECVILMNHIIKNHQCFAIGKLTEVDVAIETYTSHSSSRILQWVCWGHRAIVSF